MRNVHCKHGVEDVESIRVNALFPHDRNLAAVAAQLTSDLRSRSEWIMLRGDRPNTHTRVESNKSLRAVRQRDGHRITRPDPGLVQNPSSLADLVAYLGVGGRRSEIVQRNAGQDRGRGGRRPTARTATDQARGTS